MADTKATAGDNAEPEQPLPELTAPEEKTQVEENDDTVAAASLMTCPVETALYIFEFLTSEDLVQLAATCGSLRSLICSNDVWKSRCLALWSKHGSSDLSNGTGNPFLMSEDAAATEQFYHLYRGLLGPNARYLGDFASSLPYNGRLIRFSIHTNGEPDLPLVDRFRILARELSIANVYADRGYATEWNVPSEHHSPFRGHSMDLFEARYQWSTILAITAEEGACIPLQNNSSYIPLDLTYMPKYQTTVDNFSGSRLQDIFANGNEGWTWPTLPLIQMNALAGPLTWLADTTLEMPAVTWSPKFFQGPSQEPVIVPQEPLPVFERPGPRFIRRRPPAPVAPRTAAPVSIQIMRREEPNAAPTAFQFNGAARASRAWEEGIREVLRGRAAGSQKSELYLPMRRDVIKSVKEGEEIFPSDLAGLWAGTYGPHGIEIGYINCRAVQTVIHHADEVDIEEIDVPAGDTRNIRRGSTSGSRHIVEYCKITGDINVPSGQISWSAILPRAGATPGPLPTINEEDFQKWLRAPNNSSEAAQARWDRSVEAKGKLAFQGYVEPRQSDAEVYFIRSKLEDGREAINEIRLRWLELGDGKVSVFRRIVL